MSLSLSGLGRFDLGIGNPGVAAFGTGDLRVMLRHLSQKGGERLTASWADNLNFLIVHIAYNSIEMAVTLPSG